MCADQCAEPRDTGGDQHDVGHRAQRHHRQHVLTLDSLPQHECVLRANRGDQREVGQEADDQW